MINRIVVFFTFIILFCFLFNTESFSQSAQDVILELKPNTDIVRVGEKLIINYIIKNKSCNRYVFCSLGINYFILNRSFLNPKKQKIGVISNNFYSIRFVPTEKDFFILSPNEERVYRFQYKLEKGIKIIKDWPFFGKFLRDENDTFLVLGFTNKISLQMEYSLREIEYKVGVQNYGFNNLYEGKIKSNTINIKIK